MNATMHTLDDYALGHSDAETARLILQHQLYGPLTRQLLVSAGVTRGMEVLDLGSGAGDVSLLLAELVGPSGRVVGVDANPDILDTARARARSIGWSNISFLAGDVRDLPVADDDFDAVVGRWILMYQPDPAAVLRASAAHVRPGGIVAFQESDLRHGAVTFPPLPLHGRLAAMMTPPADVAGPEAAMGPKLHAAFRRAGLGDAQLRLEAPIGGGEDWPGYAYLAESVRSLLPMMERLGLAPPGAVEVGSLAERLRDEVVGAGAIQLLPAVVGAWARVSRSAG